jgi:hypothetical protein
MRQPGRIQAQNIVVSIFVAALVATLAAARAQEPQQLPPVTVAPDPPRSPLLQAPAPGSGGPPAPNVGTGQQTASDGKGQGRCVDVSIGNDASFGCLNQKLKQKVDEVNPPVLNTPPIDARSSDLKVGTVNVPAVQQQYGQNFGRSVIPYRPTVVYPSGMGRH